MVDDCDVVASGQVRQQRCLPGAGDAGDAGQDAQGDVDVEVVQVVGGGVVDAQGAGGNAGRGVEGGSGGEGCGGGSVRVRELGGRALEGDGAAGGAGARAQVDDVVGGGDDVGVVLDDQDGVALVAQRVQERDDLGGVVGVEPGGGFVEDVGQVGEGGVEMKDGADALSLAAGQGGGGAVQGEVAQADAGEVGQQGLQLGDERCCGW
ncbi:hypothetical protein [Arsenicicoccus dermatophilus]|uniref:hypothetical protein n=1 Tax=Arsenicicoccus dermatophilus TaxID=1076331 RepID=UPI00391751EB